MYISAEGQIQHSGEKPTEPDETIVFLGLQTVCFAIIPF